MGNAVLTSMKVENNLLSKYFFIFLEFFSRLFKSPLNKSIAISSKVSFAIRNFFSRLKFEIIFGNFLILEKVLKTKNENKKIDKKTKNNPIIFVSTKYSDQY